MRDFTLQLDVATLAHLRDAGKARNVTAPMLATMLVAQVARDNLVLAVIGSGPVPVRGRGKRFTVQLDAATMTYLCDAGQQHGVSAATMATALLARIASDRLVGAVLDNDPIIS
jgi:hypothetical protein